MSVADAVEPDRLFSITRGPFTRLVGRLHLTRPDRTLSAGPLVAIAWLPLAAAGVICALRGTPLPRVLTDVSVHVRLLIALPILVVSARILDQRCANVVSQLYKGRFATPAELDPIIDRAERLRRSRAVEIGLAVLVIAVGQVMVWTGRTGLFSGGDVTGVSFARLWEACVALPLVQFVTLQLVWAWAIWTLVVIRVARVRLATVSTHPDGRGGIGFLDEPLQAFAGFTLATTTIAAATWATQIVEHHTSASSYVTHFVMIVALATVIGCGPLCLYAGQLYRARHADGRKYNELALDYMREFHHKWIDRPPADERILGSPDVQSLNDMIGSAKHATGMRLVPFGARTLATIWAAAALPMIPLAASTMPLDELIKKLGEALLAGLPV